MTKDWEIHANCFRLMESERKKFEEWNKKHLEEKHGGKVPYAGAAGGRLTWIFTPTGLGTVVSVRCGFPACAEEECDITDYDEW